MKVSKPVEDPDRSSTPGHSVPGVSLADVPVVRAGGIDREDPEVVPAALTGLVEAARYACRAVAANGFSEPRACVVALEDTVAALVQLRRSIGPYVGDYSKHGERVLGRSTHRLAEARADLGKGPSPRRARSAAGARRAVTDAVGRGAATGIAHRVYLRCVEFAEPAQQGG